MTMASKGSQPTISRFFAPKNSQKKIVTDADLLKKKSFIAEVEYQTPLKRAGSFSSDESSPKRQKSNEAHSSQGSSGSSATNGSHNGSVNGSPTNRNINGSPSSRKNKLNAFRFKSDTPKEEDDTNDIIEAHRVSAVGHKRFSVPKGVKLTPLETQVVAIKEKHPDTLLFVECGYKYRFFGEDAEIAAKELNIIAHLDHNFQTGSIPTHRLHVHVRRLVAKGYKVGVVKQTETAALKAVGTNRTAPFSREITALYTKATLIGEDVSHVGGDTTEIEAESTTSSLMILTEAKASSEKSDETGIAFVAIQPNTGEIVYDFFDDSSARTTLWGHLERIHPVEVIVNENVSDNTRKAIKAVMTRHDDCIRIESLPEQIFEYSSSLQSLCRMYEGMEEKIRRASELPQPVVGCLGATLQYLKEFKLEKVLRTACDIIKSSSTTEYMKLPGSTLRNLDLIVNSTDGEEHGSLFWVLNHTQTKFGARVLRGWILRPLRNLERIVERQEMVAELIHSDAPPVTVLKETLLKLPDLEKSITTIFYKKCSPLEFWSTASSLTKVHARLSAVCSHNLSDVMKSLALCRLFQTIVDKLATVQEFSLNIDESSAKSNTKTSLLKDWSDFEEVINKQQEIKNIEVQMVELRPGIARTLNLPSFNYTSVSGSEYLIEVKNKDLKFVPSSWTKINSTKTCCRFRSKENEKLYSKLQQAREQLNAECHQAWLQVLDRFSEHYQDYREAVKCIGSLDALMSLAKVAQANGYCRPQVTVSDNAFANIEAGRHPIVQQLRGSEQFVANNTDMATNGERMMLVTGPNMGGKSCYMRQVALIILMAQMGSFVPGDSVHISIFDGIFTRMGATDEIFSGKSSLMVEMSETSDIMSQVTDKSLVILDELGRGTSTHDGVALATAALDFFLNTVKCLTIFVTHYLTLCEFANKYPDAVGNHHMSFIVNEEGDEEDLDDVITFLYQLTSGDAGQSYGLNVARLANVPQGVLKKASHMSKSLQSSTTRKKLAKGIFKKIFCEDQYPDRETLETILKR